MKIRNLGIGMATALLLIAAGPTASAQQADGPIYGRELMTVQERAEHRERIQSATNEEERAKIRAEHRKRIQARAQERNVELPDVAGPGRGPNANGPNDAARPARGRDLMTQEEREGHREEMRNAETKEKREKLRAEKHEKMKERAEEQGVTLPDKPLPRGRGMGQGAGPGGGRR